MLTKRDSHCWIATANMKFDRFVSSDQSMNTEWTAFQGTSFHSEEDHGFPFPKSWDRSAMFTPCPLGRMMNSGCLRMLQKPANWPSGPSARKEICHLHWVQREEGNGPTVHVGIHSSKVATLRLKVDRDHNKIMEKEANSLQAGKEKGKHTRKKLLRINNFH